MGSVLLADDNPETLKFYESWFECLGRPVESYRNGLDILVASIRRIDAGEPIDLVVVDEHMPGMSGTEYVRAFRLHERKKRPVNYPTPIFMVSGTAHGDASQKIEGALAAGVTEYFQKCRDEIKLTDRIDFILGTSVPAGK